MNAFLSPATSSFAGSGFNDRSAGSEFPFLFGSLNNPDGGAIFHAPARIQVFELSEDLGRSCGHQPSEVKHRSSADQVGYVVGDAKGRNIGNFLHVTG
jgi:hypothetical protein